MPSVEFGPNNTWDRLHLTLTASVDRPDVVSDVSSAIRCGEHAIDDNLTLALRVYDVDGTSGADLSRNSSGVVAIGTDTPNPVVANPVRSRVPGAVARVVDRPRAS